MDAYNLLTYKIKYGKNKLYLEKEE